MNLYVERSRNATAVVKGKQKRFVDRSSFNLWQTPTEVTRRLLQEKDTLAAYCDWVRSNSKDREFEIYAEDDIFQERDPIGVEVCNDGKDHIESLLEWVKESIEDGYRITFYEV
jgi:hypothetical protein